MACSSQTPSIQCSSCEPLHNSNIPTYVAPSAQLRICTQYAVVLSPQLGHQQLKLIGKERRSELLILEAWTIERWDLGPPFPNEAYD
jgi:hypothetical protein